MFVRLRTAFLTASIFILSTSASYDVRPFTVHFPPEEVSRMVSLAKNARLPDVDQFSGGGSSFGIPRGTLHDLRDKWVNNYSWETRAKALNKYHHNTVELENTTLHFVHEKSADAAATPILMLHGWPGSFLEYLPTVPLLTESLPGAASGNLSYNVIIPSLPGFGLSSLVSSTWTLDDTARILNALMVEVLGYKQYTVFGSDWGSSPAYTLYTKYSAFAKAAHFAFLPFFPQTDVAQLAAENITISPFEQEGLDRMNTFSVTDTGYFVEQSTRPNTIGLALLDNPFGQLAWIGEKLLSWSDPDRSPPSTFDDTTILDAVSLYFLTRTFLSAEWTYALGSFSTNYTVEKPVAPMGFSAFRYNTAQWPRGLVAKVGNLTVYHEHARGGHFPGIDNPTALVSDIRELGRYWEY